MNRTACLLLMLALTACGSSPTRTKLDVTASSGLNPNRDGQPSPTVVRIYELKSVDTFDNLSFFDLYDHDTEKLGGDLLNRRDLEIVPGQTKTIESKADPSAKFIGVIAAFRSITNIPWRASVPLEQESRNTIDVTLDPAALTVKKVPRPFLWIF